MIIFRKWEREAPSGFPETLPYQIASRPVLLNLGGNSS